jgi:hypothetical protein
MPEEAPRRGWALTIALVVNFLASIVGLIAVALLGKLLFVGVGPKAAIVALVGSETIVVPLLVWLVFYLAFIRRRAPGRGLVYFFALLAGSVLFNGCLFGFAAYMNGRETVQRTQAAAARNDSDVRLALNQSVDAIGALSRGQSAVGLGTNMPGAAGAIARSAKTMLVTVMQAREDSNQTARQVGFPGFMAADTLCSGNHLTRAMGLLEQLRSAELAHQRKADAAIAGLRATVAAGAMDAAVKRDGLARLDAAIAAEKSVRTTESKLYLSMLDEFEAETRDLIATRPFWKMLGGKLTFAQDEPLRRYQRHIARLKGLLEEYRKAGAAVEASPGL